MALKLVLGIIASAMSVIGFYLIIKMGLDGIKPTPYGLVWNFVAALLWVKSLIND